MMLLEIWRIIESILNNTLNDVMYAKLLRLEVNHLNDWNKFVNEGSLSFPA